LIEPITSIWAGDLGYTEGPHLLKKDGWYYLICAEDGISYEHAISVARSKTIEGPYEKYPENPILTAVDTPSFYLQKTGYGGFIDFPDGSWYTTHLCARPLTERGSCILGRETDI
jgi:xylan 1,4-beta-xylosidase